MIMRMIILIMYDYVQLVFHVLFKNSDLVDAKIIIFPKKAERRWGDKF